MLRRVALSALVAAMPFMVWLTPTPIDDLIIRHTYQFYNETNKRRLTPVGAYYCYRWFVDSIELQTLTDPYLIRLRRWVLDEYRRFIEWETQ